MVTALLRCKSCTERKEVSCRCDDASPVVEQSKPTTGAAWAGNQTPQSPPRLRVRNNLPCPDGVEVTLDLETVAKYLFYYSPATQLKTMPCLCLVSFSVCIMKWIRYTFISMVHPNFNNKPWFTNRALFFVGCGTESLWVSLYLRKADDHADLSGR